MSILSLSKIKFKLLDLDNSLFRFSIYCFTIAIIVLVLSIFFLEYLNRESSTNELPDEIVNEVTQVSLPPATIFYKMKCISEVNDAIQCNGNYFSSLVKKLEDNNIIAVKNSLFVENQSDFVLYYYAGPSSRCITHVCPKYEYYVQMDIEYKDVVLTQFSIKHNYDIDYQQILKDKKIMEKIESEGILKFKQVDKLIEFFGNLSDEKQKALLK